MIKLEKTGEKSKEKKAKENLSVGGRAFLSFLWNLYRAEAESYREWNWGGAPDEECAICFKTSPFKCYAICNFAERMGYAFPAHAPLYRAEVEVIGEELARRVREEYGAELKVDIAGN